MVNLLSAKIKTILNEMLGPALRQFNQLALQLIIELLKYNQDTYFMPEVVRIWGEQVNCLLSPKILSLCLIIVEASLLKGSDLRD